MSLFSSVEIRKPYSKYYPELFWFFIWFLKCLRMLTENFASIFCLLLDNHRRIIICHLILTLWNRRLWNGYIKEKKRKWFSRSTFVFNSSFCESHRINQLNFLKHMSAFQQGDSSSEHWLGGSVVVITALIPLHWYRWFTFQTCIMGNTSASSASRSRHISGDETGPSLTAGRFLSDSNSSTQDTYEALIKSGYRVIFSVAMLPSFCQHITLLYWQFGGKYVNNNNFKVTNVNLFTILLPSCLQLCWCWTNTAMK